MLLISIGVGCFLLFVVVSLIVSAIIENRMHCNYVDDMFHRPRRYPDYPAKYRGM